MGFYHTFSWVSRYDKPLFFTLALHYPIMWFGDMGVGDVGCGVGGGRCSLGSGGRSRLPAFGDQFKTGMYLEDLVDIFDVVPDRFDGDKVFLGDKPVAQPFYDGFQDLFLAFVEFGFRSVGKGFKSRTEELEGPGGYAWRHGGAPAEDFG